MKPIRIALAVVVLLAPLFAQQVNTNIVPASPGLSLGTPTQRWNGNFDNLDVNTITLKNGSVGGGFNCGTTSNPGIPMWNGSACLVDSNATLDGNGNASMVSLSTSASVTTPQVNTTGSGFLIGPFKTMTAPSNPQAGFMECYGDSSVNLFKCLNSDGSSALAAGGGGSLTTSVNGINLTSQSVLNFNNPASFNGLTFTYSNPTSGNLNLTVGGTLGNAGLTNPATTVNGQTCTLGSTCTVSGSSPTVVAGSSDTLTAAGTFATQTSVTAGSTSFYEIRAHGVYTTTVTASPVMAIQVNAFGTTGICTHSGSNPLNPSLTNVGWDVVCFVHILTTGAPGTATTWGVDEASNTATSGVISSRYYPQNAATQAATTTTSQTVSIQETGPLVAGTSITLQSLIVRPY